MMGHTLDSSHQFQPITFAYFTCGGNFRRVTGSLFKLLLHFIVFMPHNAEATYREHFIHNEKICPNPLHNHSDEFPKNTLLVNLPKTLSLFGSGNDFPCNFATASDDSVKKVIVRAIHPSSTLWDFSDSNTCDYFVKFKRIPEGKAHSMHSQKEVVICRVWKHEEEGIHQGSFFHPMMWASPNNSLTLSVSTYDWDYRLENNDTIPYKPSYLQLVFLIYGENNNFCSVVVQQYLIDPLEGVSSNCTLSSLENYRHCGQYECSEAKDILQSIGFRTYEIDDIKFTSHVSTTTSIPVDSSPSTSTVSNAKDSKEGGAELSPTTNLEGNTSVGEVSEDELERTTSTIEEFDIFKTTSRTTTFYNNTVTGANSVHSYAVSSIVIVPIIVILIVILSIRCYLARCNSGFTSYESSESLIVPLSRHSVMVNTQVSENGTVEIHDYIPPGRSWSRRSSMNFIQPFEIRNMTLSATASKTTISAPPSYETLGPPRYSDAVVI